MKGIVLFMNGKRGLVTADALLSAGHEICCACIPDQCSSADEITARFAGGGTSIERQSRVNEPEFIAQLAAMAPRLGIIAGFSTIFRKPLIETPELGTINLHAGRLPEYRGGSPLNWQIINGETSVGISVIRVDEGIDTGAVLAEADIEVRPDDDIADLHAKANERFPELTVQVVSGLDTGGLEGRVQDAGAARYWHQRAQGDGEIDWTAMTASQVHDLVRGITRPYPGAFTRIGDDIVRIFRTELPETDICGVPGRVCWIGGRGPFVVCRDRAVLIADCDGMETKFVNRAFVGRSQD